MSHAPVDRAEILSVLCRGRTPCEEISRVELDGPGTVGKVLYEIALHEFGEDGRSHHEPCAPFEHWLIDRDGSALLLLEVCNDGYGMGRGRDRFSLEGDLFTHTQDGGSSWTWTKETTIDLSAPRIIEERTIKAWSMGGNIEKASWDWNALAGFVHWKAPICDDETIVDEPDLDIHDLTHTRRPTYRYDILPQISLPETFGQDLWRSTDLGTCSIEVNARAHTNAISGQGFVIHGEAGDGAQARFHAVMGSPTELYVEVVDPNWNVDQGSWLEEDHLQIWVGEKTSYHAQCIDAETPSQWVISLGDGAVHAGQGSPPGEALRAEVHRVPQEADEKIRLRIEFAEAPEALTIAYRDSFSGEGQDRIIATSALRSGEAATLGKVKVIAAADGHCVINAQGALEFVDRRRFTDSFEDDAALEADSAVSELVRAEALETQGGVFAYAGRAQVKGVLQVYWHSDFETPDSAPNRALGARFILGKEQAQHLVEFPDDPYERSPRVLIFHLGREGDTAFITGREVSRLAAKLVENVEEIPEHFFRYQEGHIEQPGVLTFEGLTSIIECDAPYTFVEFASFAPLAMTEETRAFIKNVLAEPHRGGCGTSAPWEESFMVSDGQPVYAEPSEAADIVGVPSTSHVVKIRTVNDEWTKVYAYPDTEVRGFVPSDQLEPVN